MSQMQVMQVRIPENASPGSTMNISLADGRRIGIQVPQGALPGTVIQFQVPLSQSQPTSQQRYTQQPTSQPQKHDEHQYNEEINRRRRQEEQKNINQRRNAGQQRNENPKEDQFEMIGLSKRNSVHPENNHHNLNGRSNYKSSSVVPYNGSGSGGGGGGVNNNLHLERRSNNSSSLGDGHISFCCCFNQQILTNMSNISFCLTLACCSATGFLRLLPWYSEQLYTIQESHVGIIEDLGGKFVRVEKSGIILLSAPCAVPLESIKETLSTRIQQLVVKLETKTKDNVFCIVEVSLQYMLDPLNIEQAAEAAAYKVEDIKQLISDQITDIVRSKLSKVELDQAFVLKNELQSDIENRLSAVINEYGYVIQKALITNLIPTKTVVNEMNNIYLQKLQKVVNEQLAETQKLINVKKAEGESERKELLGKGVSLMRRAYLLGMQQCLEDFVQSMSKDSFILTWEDVLYMQLLLQYFDTQKGLSTKSHSSDLYISLDPKRVQEFKQMMNVGIDLNNIEHDV